MPNVARMEMALRAALSDVPLETRPMFGGIGFYAHGRIFAGWFGGDTLAFKLPESARAQLLTLPGAARTWAQEYVEIPTWMLDDVGQLGLWAARSVEYALRVAPPRKPRHAR